MKLNEQIISFLVSMCFGIYFALILDISSKILVKINKVLQFLISLTLVMINVIIYFMILLKLNNAIIHPYYIISIIIAFIIENIVSKYIKRIVISKKK